MQAYCFKEGHGVKPNEKKARTWFEKLAKVQKVDKSKCRVVDCSMLTDQQTSHRHSIVLPSA